MILSYYLLICFFRGPAGHSVPVDLATLPDLIVHRAPMLKKLMRSFLKRTLVKLLLRGRSVLHLLILLRYLLEFTIYVVFRFVNTDVI